MSLPHVFMIGAAKAGTTSLHAILDEHPKIFGANPKEPEFFARDDLYEQGLASYEALFEEAAPDQLILDSSTIYSHAPLFPDTAARIRQHVPEAKIIYVLREPVSRAYSYYIQIIKNYQNDTKDYAVHRTFEDFILPERHAYAAARKKCFASYNAHLPDVPELCLAGSDYLLQAKTYLAEFPRDQILFLTFEEFRDNRQACARKITDFLGLEPLAPEVFADTGVTRNISSEYFNRVESTRRVLDLKRRFAPLWGLRHLLPDGMRGKLRGAAAKTGAPRTDHVPPMMLPQTRAMLQARFDAQHAPLEQLTGLDLGAWQSARPAASAAQ